MHRNTFLSLYLVAATVVLLGICSCNGGSTVVELTEFEGVWEMHAEGTGVLSDFANPGPRHITYDKVFSIYPKRIVDNKGYDWDYTYDGTNLQFELLRTIPVADYSCGAILLEGLAQFNFPNINSSDITHYGIMTLDNGTVTCENSPSVTGTVTGTFSVYIQKR